MALFFFGFLRERSENADEEGSEAEGRVGDEDDSEPVAAQWTDQDSVPGDNPPQFI